MHKLSEILTNLMQECDLDDASLARQTSLPASTISRLKLNPEANPTISSLAPLAKYFGITIDQLMGWAALPKDRIPGSFNPEPQFTVSRIPVISWKWIVDWCKGQTKAFDSELTNWISTEKSLGNNAFALIIPDNEMCLTFGPGSVLIVDPDIKPRNRDIVVMSMGDNSSIPVLKTLILDGDEIYIKSVNLEITGIKPLDQAAKIWGVISEIKYSLQSAAAPSSETKKAKELSDVPETSAIITR